MKRFLLFQYDTFYPAGGFNDFVGSYDTVEQAKEAMVSEWTQIFDTKENVFVKTGDVASDAELKHLQEKIDNDSL